MKTLLLDFVVIFVVVFVVATIVSFVYNIAFHGAGVVEWETSFRLAIILGIVLTWQSSRERKK